MSPETLKLIYEEHFIKMMKYAMSIVKSKEVAYDIVIDVFVAAYISKVELVEYKTWLMTSVKNKCIDELRKRETRKSCEYDDDIHYIPESFRTNFILAETLMGIEDAIEQLPKQTKIVFQLHLAGLATDKIAAKLNIAIQTVRNNRSIAIRKLKKVAYKYC